MRKVSMLLLFILLLLTIQGQAQNISGQMSGRILDAQGAAVPGATVTASDPSKNVTVSTKTNEQGDFVFPGLQPGLYNLRVEAPGFKRLDRSAIPLDANDKLALGALTVEVGALTEAVEVSAEIALLQTESVERSATIVGEMSLNIAVNGGN